MKLDFKSTIDKLREFWSGLAKKTKYLLLAAAGGVLALIVLVTVLLNISKGGYRVIFPGMSNEESTQVYATLQEMNVQPQINEKGQIIVPADQWDDLVFQLNSKGYPKTTLSYDTFSSLSGFTATEFEKRTGLIFEAQDRMQKTLLRQTGIEDAVVNFTVPETSNYIWDQTNQQTSTAGVSVRMRQGYELTPERVSAIKHLAATAIPKLNADDVVVVDAATGVEMPGLDDPNATGYYSVQRLDYEQLIAKRIEDNVKRLLASRYGTDGVTAVATVVLDYDKMVSGSKQYQNNGNGNTGVTNHFEERYSLGGTVAAGGIVGEENNTDYPPTYPNDNGDGEAGVTDYYRNIDYDVSYIMTQIEKGEPVLQRASVAVIVNDENFNIEIEDTLIQLISKAVNITTDNISVTNLALGQTTPTSTSGDGLSSRQRLLLILGLALLFIILIIIIVVALLLGRRKKKEDEDEEVAEIATEEDIQREIEEHKRMLQSEALANSNPKESAITEEIRSFAQENPEITASLLRSLLREEQ